jgi:FHA domain-containing protein
MCSTPLVQSDVPGLDALGGDSLHTTVVFKNLKTQQGTGSLMECLICPECQTINHLGWLFCPQCGKQVDASFLQTMELADQAPTMVADMAPPQRPLQTAVAQNQSPEAQRAADTGADPQGFPQQSAQVSPQPRPQPANPDLPRREPAEQPAVSANSSNGAADREPNAPAPAIQHTTVACAECGSDNYADYAYCLNCGASLPVTKTIVMASIAHRLKPRLRLLVQGGVSGPTYEIKNEARIGRTEGSITFPHDSLMSSTHARVFKSDADFILVDEASSSGTFIRVKSETKLEPGDVILVGGQLFRFEA